MSGPPCRWCKTLTFAEFVDVGVGYVQVTGGECPGCGGRELASHQIDGRLTEEEMATGWLAPMDEYDDQ